MSHHGPIIGEFGTARVLFPSPRHRIPPALQTEFDLLLLSRRDAVATEDWVHRLEVALGITGDHRRAHLYAERKSRGLKARGDPEEIDAMLRAGVPIREVAQRLGLQRSYIQWRAKQLRADGREHNTDITTPKFADDDRHVAAVRAMGGFGVLRTGIFRRPTSGYHGRGIEPR